MFVNYDNCIVSPVCVCLCVLCVCVFILCNICVFTANLIRLI